MTEVILGLSKHASSNKRDTPRGFVPIQTCLDHISFPFRFRVVRVLAVRPGCGSWNAEDKGTYIQLLPFIQRHRREISSL